LYLNGAFCGALEAPQSFPLTLGACVYLDFKPFAATPGDVTLAMAAELRLQGDRLIQAPAWVYALQWPDGWISLELRPPRLIMDAAGSLRLLQAEDAETAEEAAPPIAPLETAGQAALRACLEALAQGQTQTAAAYLTAQAAHALAEAPAFSAVLPLPWPPLSGPPDCPLCLGCLQALAPNLGRVHAACARGVATEKGVALDKLVWDV
jgi:hypothetical protein